LYLLLLKSVYLKISVGRGYSSCNICISVSCRNFFSP
jgi:hypothetical protein